MLEVRSIKNGIVIDHIKAGNGLKVFTKLFPKTDEYPTVLLMNVDSVVLGKKDIIKIENCTDVDLDFIGLLDPNISVNIIKDEKVFNKRTASLPKEVKGLFKCENPRCITNHDAHCTSTFELIDDDVEGPKYVCKYCEEITNYRAYLLFK
jgi:aspartate carbamoyltransferase regulatory subunit